MPQHAATPRRSRPHTTCSRPHAAAEAACTHVRLCGGGVGVFLLEAAGVCAKTVCIPGTPGRARARLPVPSAFCLAKPRGLLEFGWCSQKRRRCRTRVSTSNRVTPHTTSVKCSRARVQDVSGWNPSGEARVVVGCEASERSVLACLPRP